MRFFISIVFLSIVASACETSVVIEEISQNNTSYYVVYGFITDEKNVPFTINISKTTPLFVNTGIPFVSNASVYLFTDNQQKIPLFYTKNGNYKTDSNTFESNSHNEYQLVVEMENTSRILSSYQRIPDPIIIDSVSYEYVEDINNGIFTSTTGYFVKIYIFDRDEKDSFYRITVKKNTIPYKKEMITLFYDTYFDRKDHEHILTDYVFQKKDTVEITVHSLSFQTYTFFKNLKDITSFNWQILNTAKDIPRNMQHQNNEKVLGYFGTSSVVRESIIIE
ncbi:MAG: hypothetical protein QM536_06650 [Chitinophagaceae bacterium]|nr:hypothetical protein [Chitinophagaceae bacterium]